MTRASSRGGKAPARARPLPPIGYLQQSEQPLTSLVFLLPLMVLYEVGTRWYNADIIAFDLLRDFFRLFGVTGRYLPALAVVGILLAWHIAKSDPWRVSPHVIGWMLLESIGLGAPVILLNIATRYHFPLATSGESLPGSLASSIGAGIYEELVFRLIAFTVLSLLLTDWLKVPHLYDLLLVVAISSVLFSLYHYLGSESFSWQTFVFRTAAGAYFGVVFLTRGFGITAGSHAFYDIMVSLLIAWHTG
jgi:membrane protease YdiL (CAAX protease family)